MKKPSSKGNDTNRPNGKAFKSKPRKQRKTGRTIDGYKPEKLKIRELKRMQPHVPNQTTIDAMNDAVDGKTFKTLD
jgi:hypothetical protein